MGSDSRRWLAYAGIYTLIAGGGLLVPLWVIVRTLGGILGLSTVSIGILVPTSGAVIGTIVWWMVIEHGNRYTYPRASAGGLLTALLTVLSWTLLVAVVWGPSAVQAARFVILFVVVVVSVVGVVVWFPLMFVRRRWVSERFGGNESHME